MGNKKNEKSIPLTFSFMSDKKSLGDVNADSIRAAVESTMKGEYEFISINPSQPLKNISFIQATAEGVPDGKIEVEIAIESENARIYFKHCEPEECINIMERFIGSIFSPDMAEYKPLQFLWNFEM